MTQDRRTFLGRTAAALATLTTATAGCLGNNQADGRDEQDINGTVQNTYEPHAKVIDHSSRQDEYNFAVELGLEVKDPSKIFKNRIAFDIKAFDNDDNQIAGGRAYLLDIDEGEKYHEHLTLTGADAANVDRYEIILEE